MQKKWINIGKLAAILAVLTDHTMGLLYVKPAIQHLSFYSVTLFIFLSGITSYISCERHISALGLKYTIRRVGAIFIPYAFAGAFYCLLQYNNLNVIEYWSRLWKFDIAIHFYFVLFYIELIIIAPFLYNIIIAFNRFQKMKYLFHAVMLIIVGFVSMWLMKFTSVDGQAGGALYLFGGSYLAVFYAGMVFSSFNIRLKTVVSSVIVTCAFAAVVILFIVGISSNGPVFLDEIWLIPFPYGMGVNPPGVTLMMYATAIGILIFAAVSLMEAFHVRTVDMVLKILSKIGSYSLYIFLYHIAVRDWIFYHLMVRIHNGLLLRLIFYASMVFVPILIAALWQKIKQACKRAMQNKISEGNSTL